MDETYIRMSEQARKYLPPHEWQDGDWYSENGQADVYCSSCEDERGPYDKRDWIPLLRQDQLQEMVPSEDGAFVQLCCLYKFCMDNPDYLINPSMEQLWLAFVMRENYGRTWNGEDWVMHELRT